MSDIRVTYSGMVSFAVGTLTLISGLIFTLVIARGLSITEYGTWAVIWGLLAYVLLLDPAISYWATREAAQGTKSARTALAASAGTSAIATLAYIVIAYVYAPSGDADSGALLFAALLVPAELIRRLLAALALAHRPHMVEYALFAGELIKTVLAAVMIFSYSMGIEGVIIAALIGAFGNIAILAVFLRRNLTDNIDMAHIKKWARLVWIPTWRNLVPLLTRSDIVIFSIMTGSVVGVAYWTAARTIAAITAHAARMNAALYPKLLGGGERAELEENLVLVLYVTLALVAVSAALAAPALYALGEEYEAAAPVVLLLIALVSLRMLANVFARALTGVEDVDTVTTHMRAHLKGSLFMIPTLMIAQRGAYLIALVAMLAILVPVGIATPELVTYWAALALIAHLPHFAHLCVLVRREFQPKISVVRLAKYALCACVAFGTMYVISEQVLERGDIFEFIPKLVGTAAVGIALYAALTYTADSKIRRLANSAIHEMRTRS